MQCRFFRRCNDFFPGCILFCNFDVIFDRILKQECLLCDVGNAAAQCRAEPGAYAGDEA